jgi:tRNA threonylcarbamoyladenosine biosynthesis protein TsaB
MIILSLRTDKPEAEIGLFDGNTQLAYSTWQAHRELAETLHTQLRAELNKAGLQLSGIQGLVVYQGPGSFTGLRIGVSVANALAYGLQIAIVGQQGDSWLADGQKRLQSGENDGVVIPEYGSPPHTTTPKH